MALLCELSAERNAIIDKFQYFGIKCNSAFETQALLQLKKEYCDLGRCTSCAIGADLLKSTVAK
ncbi:MAG TPA: hypothetical protein VFQ50_06710 [Flavobacterium sp.]|nr:hypothetical protein [Flavobacterium sp.]